MITHFNFIIFIKNKLDYKTWIQNTCYVTKISLYYGSFFTHRKKGLCSCQLCFIVYLKIHLKYIFLKKENEKWHFPKKRLMWSNQLLLC